MVYGNSLTSIHQFWLAEISVTAWRVYYILLRKQCKPKYRAYDFFWLTKILYLKLSQLRLTIIEKIKFTK